MAPSPETRSLRVGLAQMAPAPSAVADNVARVTAALADCADDLLVFPELFLSGIRRDGYERVAVALDGPEVHAICQAAAASRTAVAVGAALRGDDGIRNVALVVSATGEIAGVRAKTHQWASEGSWLVAGDEIAPVALGDVSVGVMVCFDVEFPEVARTLAVAGADLLVTIAANMEPFGLDHATFARARAMENGLPHVYVNRVGTEAGERFLGESAVVGVDGATLAAADPGEQVVRVDVPLGNTRADARVDYVRLRRAELYGALT